MGRGAEGGVGSPDHASRALLAAPAASTDLLAQPGIVTSCIDCLPQDVMKRVNMDMEGLARSIPPATRMLCLHGTADKTIPWEVRCSWGAATRQAASLSRAHCAECRFPPSAPHPAVHRHTRHCATPTLLPQESKECASLVPSAELQLIEGADHNFNGQAAGEEMARRVVAFVLS